MAAKKARAPRREQTDKPPKTKASKSGRKRKKGAEPGSVGIAAEACARPEQSADIDALRATVEACGGAILAHYREPLGGHDVLFAALPLEAVEPTPYQRELSKAHADKLAGVIPKVGRFLDPVIAVEHEGKFITPNGMHRLNAMRALGAKAITALVLPEREVSYRILALNTEKAHNLRDKALEVVRMYRALAADAKHGKRTENEFALEFEQPGLLTLGFCYEQNGRFSGGAYAPVVNRCESFREEPLAHAIELRETRAAKLLALDALVNEAVKKLKESGFQSGYLKPVVVARINPLRFVQAKPGEPVRGDFDKTIDKMSQNAQKFDASKVKASDFALAAAMGGAEGE
jgi:ParB family transcriptional regulator, chromosome partitioning protein